MTGYFCQVCGAHHNNLPMSYGSPAPADWFALTEDQRESRAVLSSDQCIIDNEFFFLAGNIDIPIIGEAEIFNWTVWVAVTKRNFYRATELWEQKGRESEPPYFGWLNTSLLGYPPTLNLKINLHTRPVGQRPFVELEPTEHPLAVEQRKGITRHRVQEIAEVLLHGAPET